MKKVLTILALLFLSFIHCAFAQTTTPSPKDKKIKEFMDLTGAGKMGVQAVQTFMNAYKAQYSDVPTEFWDKFSAEIKADDLVAMIIPIYSKYYEESELDELIRFYKTPVGKKVIAVMPQIMQESMMAGQTWGQKIGEKVAKELMEKGYKPKES